LLFVAGNESDNIGVIDVTSGRLVRSIVLDTPVQPQRIVVTPDGLLVAGGAKFVNVLDVKPLISDVTAAVKVGSYCLFPCGSPTTHAAHGAVDYSISSVSVSPTSKEAVIGIVDRRIKKGALVGIDIAPGGALRTGWFQAAFAQDVSTGN
jgi:DNA-binding beta-propeller fold protein YncE